MRWHRWSSRDPYTIGARKSARAPRSRNCGYRAARAAARQRRFASVPPLVRMPEPSAGRRSISRSQRSTVSSTATARGRERLVTTFRFSAAATPSASTATGAAELPTYPKNLGCVLAASNGAITRAISSSTASGSPGSTGNGPPTAASASSSEVRAAAAPLPESWSRISAAARAVSRSRCAGSGKRGACTPASYHANQGLRPASPSGAAT